jgi:nucleoside-diphosphate-sugar epimerase
MNTVPITIAILGGSGFIGSCLARNLQRNATARFVIVDKVESRCYPDQSRVADIRSADALRAEIPEGSVLINLAAEHRDDVMPRTLYDEVNVQGARNICAVAREKNVATIVFTSSVAVYGFAPPGTDESGAIQPFNDYGRTKYEAEQVFRVWQAEAPAGRTLVVVRPTVVFGERNRGNVYNLLRQIASGRFVMVGDGKNRKSMAYVENVAAFLEYAIAFAPGVHVYNFIDKPDFTMNALIGRVNEILGKSNRIGIRIPFFLGYSIGKCFDLLAAVTGRKFAISSIRVKKFCANSMYASAAGQTGFVAPVPISEALTRTVRYEFVESHEGEDIFNSE